MTKIETARKKMPGFKYRPAIIPMQIGRPILRKGNSLFSTVAAMRL
jgi:hypothetical protein